MTVYQKMYGRLFGRVTDAIELLEKGENKAAAELLKNAQRETEEMYINSDEEA